MHGRPVTKKELIDEVPWVAAAVGAVLLTTDVRHARVRSPVPPEPVPDAVPCARGRGGSAAGWRVGFAEGRLETADTIASVSPPGSRRYAGTWSAIGSGRRRSALDRGSDHAQPSGSIVTPRRPLVRVLVHGATGVPQKT